MLLPRLRRDRPAGFALATAGEPATREAWVERVSRRRARVDVRLLLDDGSTARLVLDPEQASWHEIAAGQIVGLRRQSLPGDPGIPLVCECVHVGG